MEINSVDCPKCGAGLSDQISQGKIFKCGNCGSSLVWPESQSKLVLSFGARLCRECGVDNELSRNYCRNCGSALTKTCPSCNTVFYVGDKLCPNGHDYENKQNEEAMDILEEANAAYDGGTKLETLLGLCESALSLNPRFAGAYYLKGIVLEDKHKWEDSLSAYRNAKK